MVLLNSLHWSQSNAESAPTAAACTERRYASAGCLERAASEEERCFRAEEDLDGVFPVNAALENEDGVLRAERCSTRRG